MVSRDFFFFLIREIRAKKRDFEIFSNFRYASSYLLSLFLVVVFISSGIRILIFQIFYKFVRRKYNSNDTRLFIFYFFSSIGLS